MNKKYHTEKERIEAKRIANRKWRTENPEKVRESYRKWLVGNLEVRRTIGRKWRAKNPEREKEIIRKWRTENPEKVKEYNRKQYAKNPEKRRAISKKRRFIEHGITEAIYDKMYLDQSGTCAICGKTETKLNIDHCHISGENRSLLCSKCNSVLGMSSDNPTILQRAIDYIEHHVELIFLT